MANYSNTDKQGVPPTYKGYEFSLLSFLALDYAEKALAIEETTRAKVLSVPDI